jgi:2-methylcitrate dehydratase
MASPTPNTEIHSYDQVLIDIVQYVYHTKVDSPRAYERARIALLDALGCAIETLSVSPGA